MVVYIVEYIMEDAQNEQIHEVERNLFGSLLQLGNVLLELFLECKGDGNVGAMHRDIEYSTLEVTGSQRTGQNPLVTCHYFDLLNEPAVHLKQSQGKENK